MWSSPFGLICLDGIQGPGVAHFPFVSLALQNQAVLWLGMKLLVQQSTPLLHIKSLLHLQNLWLNTVTLSLLAGFVSFHNDPRPYILFLWVTFPVFPVILFLVDCNFC